MEQVKPYFTFDGRVRRSTFWANLVAIGVISFFLSLWCVNRYTSWYDFEEHTFITHKPIYYGWLVIAGWRVASISARRWQDLDRSGMLAVVNVAIFISMMEVIDVPDGLAAALLLLTSLGGLAVVGFQGFMPGDQGANQFGPAPAEGQIW